MKKLTTLFSLLFCLTLVNFAHAQATFQKTYGGAFTDLGNSVQQTSDGGYIIAGETNSFGVGNRDAYLIRLDSFGTTLWSKTYGGNSEDYAITLDQTADSGFIFGAHTGSFGFGSHDYYLVKTDKNGDTLWTKLYGGTAADGIYSLHETLDGGFIIGGHTSSFGAGAHDFYLIKTNASGDTSWTKTYGGNGGDYLRATVSLELTGNPHYVMVGETSGFGIAGFDMLVIRTDGLTGDTTWSKTFGGNANDYANGIYETADTGLIIVGNTNSFGAGGMDVYLIKTDTWGNIQWSKTYGGAGEEFGYAVQQTSDGGYIIVGSSTSFGAGLKDVYVIKTDVNGDTLWTKAYGSQLNEVGLSVQQTADGGYVITGNTSGFGAGAQDIYVIKTDANGNSGCHEYSTNTLYSNSATIETRPNLIVRSGTSTGGSATVVNNPITIRTSVCDSIIGLDHSSLFNSDLSVKIYPNPTNHHTTLEFDNTKKDTYTLTIHNAQGQLLRTINNITTNKITVDTYDMSAGLYFFQIGAERQVRSTPVLIIE